MGHGILTVDGTGFIESASPRRKRAFAPSSHTCQSQSRPPKAYGAPARWGPNTVTYRWSTPLLRM